MCAIYLSEFTDGEKVLVLLRCRHGLLFRGSCSTTSSSSHLTALGNISLLLALPISHLAPLRPFLSSHRLLTVVAAVAAAMLAAALVYIIALRSSCRCCHCRACGVEGQRSIGHDTAERQGRKRTR